MSIVVVKTERDMAACLELRRQVFIVEQAVPVEEERDALDATATHLLARIDGAPMGTARIVIKGESGKIGRVCVLPQTRGTGLGKRLILACLQECAAMGLTRAVLGSQTHAIGFYEKIGFTAFGPLYDDAGIEHRDMEIALAPKLATSF